MAPQEDDCGCKDYTLEEDKREGFEGDIKKINEADNSKQEYN